MNEKRLSYLISPLDFSDDQINITYLKQQLEAFQQWSMVQFKQQVDIDVLVHLRSQFIDQLLERLWRFYQIPKHVSSFFKRNRIALVAVGGYGRAELHPLSDIDILILSDYPLTKEIEKQIGNLVRLLWDLHLDIGHSVRTLRLCLQEAKNDISIMTNLIESRLISGNQLLLDELHKQIFSDKIWPSREFYKAKIQEQQERHKQYHSTSYNLEPDLKNSPGGLRDMQIIQWIAIRHFGGEFLQKIADFNYLTPEDIEDFKTCRKFLWRMRFALHCVITRYDNRLLFDRQLSIANMLGYQGEGNAPVEKMMHDYYRVAHNITELNQMLLQLFYESILEHNSKNKPYDIDEHFQIRDKLIDVKDDEIFKKDPVMIMQLFYTMLLNPQITGLYSNTIRQLRSARKKLNTLLCEDPKARQIFMMIIKHPDAIKKAILPMHQYGILAVYIPEWKHIAGMMQFDLFHAYTVDEHTIRLLIELDNLKTDDGKQKHPNSSTVFTKLSKPELLIITGLFHDIGKGRHGDHSEIGAKLVEKFCQLHQLDAKDTDLIIWLVRYHLLMSVTAQNRDLQDPAVIREFIQLVKSKRRLQYLLCLTIADVCATNETLWNSWKQSLMRELYFTAMRSFDSGIHQIPEQRNIARQHKQEALAMLLKQNYDEWQIKNFWQNYRVDYFLRYTTEQIVVHAQNLLHHDLTQTLVLINPNPYHGGSEIFIYSPDRPYLFATVCNILSMHNLTIHDALIITNKKGFALDTFIVLEPNGQTVQEDRHQDIIKALEKALQRPIYQGVSIKPPKKKLQSFCVPTQVNFLSSFNERQTYMELIALDRPGLLACVGEIFANLDLSLRSAKIATIGEHIEDLFILTSKYNNALDDMTCNQLRESIINAIDAMS
ncbi:MULTISPECIES: bifunctional uridylyltransferase/uridylyl-removing protein GlnD [unclassified Gilliamella]|uniref:bifunctional uridylyltransferase/uridylyl-removing protein GlnD n=1 Tax=unclassified Gilliamella TaxID=2685620 RepID=UPI00130CD631|nr:MULTISPECIES: bifunctional uridylyltransferase/uridylyl-removing protein GlnD [unclassified Gilliamella]MWP48408.1 bifunctional uridylyltransferase/uridylyl-removing protein GlnD [Gilliamella sp. Lep-s35]MWP68313.1 bifunctional uridylyltransferase/uridylyl-removing protein GlnD [Gilliamella sp. Lep-s5]MWP76548.1 bifunctional uridylyltransferase/uridylyl-removing protein GlnD [Gilliamella sp. Lep-s21]